MADDSTLCVAGRASDYAAMVSTDSFEVEAITQLGGAPSWATTSPNGRHCHVANNRDDTVSVISYASGAEVARIPVGEGPKHLEPGEVPARAVDGS